MDKRYKPKISKTENKLNITKNKNKIIFFFSERIPRKLLMEINNLLFGKMFLT
jgi:hypothetical protein